MENLTIKLTEQQIRKLVMEQMHHTGHGYRNLPQERWETAWFLADGFGPITDRKFAEDNCWDWSHVRDSSPEALLRMAQFLCSGANTESFRLTIKAEA